MTITDSLCVDHTSLNDDNPLTPSASASNGSESARSMALSFDREFNLSYDGPSFSTTKEERKTESKTSGTSSGSIKSTSPNKSFKSPNVEKVWIPLSQSTPMGNDVQPKDILKAKSKLSNLIESVHRADDNDSLIKKDEHNNEEEDEDERSSSFDDTPSKLKPNGKKATERTLSPSHKRDLEEFKRLKEFISKIPSGSLLLDSFQKKSTSNVFVIHTLNQQKADEDLLSSIKQENVTLKTEVGSLNNDIKFLKTQNEGLKQELTNLHEVNKQQSEEFSSSAKTNADTVAELKTQIKTLTDSLEQKTQVENNLRRLNQSLEAIRGDTESVITKEKFPSLIKKYSHLELFEVDLLSQIQAQNIIKNVLINLNIPYSQIKERITQMSDVLKNEQTLFHFANQIHHLLYEEKFKLLNNDKNGLQHCTKQMYQNVELLYNVLKK